MQRSLRLWAIWGYRTNSYEALYLQEYSPAWRPSSHLGMGTLSRSKSPFLIIPYFGSYWWWGRLTRVLKRVQNFLNFVSFRMYKETITALNHGKKRSLSSILQWVCGTKYLSSFLLPLLSTCLYINLKKNLILLGILNML
jgi:hypothetical protein